MRSNEQLISKRNRIPLLLILLLTTPLAAQVDAEFTPLITSPGLEHFIGDKQYWSFQNGVLASQVDGRPAAPALILSTERFGNFILRFKARGGELRVLFRATIQPPGLVLGYEAEVGGERPGNLTSRNPGPVMRKLAGAGHAGQGFPDGLEMPFFREAAETALVEASARKADAYSNQWVEYEISGLGDHIVVTVNGVTRAHYRSSKGSEEGMLGFRLVPGASAKVAVKDIQVRLLGDVRWPTAPPPGNLTSAPAQGWTASPGNFERVSDEAWKCDSRELLSLASDGKSFRPLFDGKTLAGWQDANTFWSVKEGGIEGDSHNSFLVTEQEYSDFILKGFVRLMPASGNSGVQVRSAVIPDGMRGYQFDIGGPWWGQLYDESTQRGILVPVDNREKRLQLTHLDGWNEFIVICRGNHLIGKLNGEVTYDFIDYYGEKTGHIGLQIHVGSPMTVDFRDLQIKVLPD